MGDDIAQGDDGHIAPGEGEGGVAGSEEAHDGVHPQQRHQCEDYARKNIEGNLVGEDLGCDGIVFLAQQDGNHRCRAHAHQRSQRRGDVHQREGDGQAGDGQGAGFRDMADEDAVDHIVQRRRRHRDDAGNGVLPQECAYGLCAQFGRNGRAAHCLSTSCRSKRRDA